jgi:predicted DNA-binding ribbon-helix-helix protein
VKSPVAKRSIVVGGRKTSVSLEEAFWTGMKEIAEGRSITLSDLVGEIDRKTRPRKPVVGHPALSARLLPRATPSQEGHAGFS